MPRLSIENETHWRSTDFKRLVRAATEAVDFQQEVKIRVRYAKGIAYPLLRLISVPGPLLFISLGKRGSKEPHPVPMVAMAASYAVRNEIPEDSTLLSFGNVYYIANYTAFLLAKSKFNCGDSEDKELCEQFWRFQAEASSVECPSWMPPEKCFIAKYRDPKKHASYLDFIKKKEKLIAKLDAEIDDYEGQIARLTKLLKRRVKKRKAAEKSIRDARRRRS